MSKGKSLQDQLLSLGVVDQKSVKQAKHAKRLAAKAETKHPSVAESLALTQQQARDAKKAKDQGLAMAREAKRRQAERLSQVRDMVASHGVARGAEPERVDFRFPYGKKIRPYPVSAAVRDQLARGMLGLIELDGAILIVPREILERCRERLEDQDIFTHLAKLEVDEGDYPPIPDDLDW